MAFKASIIADSISDCGLPLTTMEITYPRFVHAEFMTHRLFSRNAASSRAIPIEKMIEAVRTDPAMPVWWGKNQSGMQAKEELTGDALSMAKQNWLRASQDAVDRATALSRIGLHKQIANRLLEPWAWITVIVTATDYGNFFAQRCHPDAQPEIRHIAEMMRDLYFSSDRSLKHGGEWHLPYIQPEEFALPLNELRKISVARCARVSYLTHDGVRDHSKDIDLFEKLVTSGHWSPFEHVAKAQFQPMRSGNFYGWDQYRKDFTDEFRSYSIPSEASSE